MQSGMYRLGRTFKTSWSRDCLRLPIFNTNGRPFSCTTLLACDSKDKNPSATQVATQTEKTAKEIDFSNIKKVKEMIRQNERGEVQRDSDKKVIFTEEEKAIMQNVNQRIPCTVEKEPGVFMFENTVRPLMTFPDPSFAELATHEEYKEYTLGYPVIREPHLYDRWREGMRFRKSSPEEYPWIQEFKQHYDMVIIGGGIVGSCIANFLAERIEVGDGYSIAVIDKDPTYRRCNSTQMLGGLRSQFSLPENVELGMFCTDFLRMSKLNLAVPNEEGSEEYFFNVPKVKYQPHGTLTLATEDQMKLIEEAHETQKLSGAQTALLSKRGLEKRFPWLNTNGLAGGCLGLEFEGWFDAWNLLQSLQIRNKHLGVDYIHGEVIYFKQHCHYMEHQQPDSGTRCFEAHMFLPNTKYVYPIHFSRAIIAAGAQSGNIGRMAGIGTGRGPLFMDIPVEPRRGYIFEIKCPDGPGLNFPIVSDPSGFFMRRNGYLNHYLVGKLPSEDMNEKIPENMFGDVDPSYFEEVILPLIQYRIPGFKNYTLVGSWPVDYDYNYIDQTPVVGPHPVHNNLYMACGFNGRGAQYGPGVGRAIMELILDDGYVTTDLSRFSFDRFFMNMETKELLYA